MAQCFSRIKQHIRWIKVIRIYKLKEVKYWKSFENYDWNLQVEVEVWYVELVLCVVFFVGH